MQPRKPKDIQIRVYEAKLPEGHITHWRWCADNLTTGTWYAHYGLMKSGPSSYWFENTEDALAFKMTFWGTVLL